MTAGRPTTANAAVTRPVVMATIIAVGARRCPAIIIAGDVARLGRRIVRPLLDRPRDAGAQRQAGRAADGAEEGTPADRSNRFHPPLLRSMAWPIVTGRK